MKECKQCGFINTDDANFCEKCGGNLINQDFVTTKDETENKGKIKNGNKGKLIGIIIAIVVLVLAGIVAISWVNKQKAVKEYGTLIESAERYLEELDYEQAEAAYLKAIEIDPKQRKAYVDLAEIYVKQNELDKADEILKQADLAGATYKEEEQIQEKEENIKKQIESGITYSWVVEPTIEAEEIYYVKSEGDDWKTLEEESENILQRQHMDKYALIKQNGMVGLIDMEGNLITNVEYQNIDRFYTSYLFYRQEPFDLYGYKTNLGYLNEYNEVVGIDGLGGPGVGVYGYKDGLHNTMDGVWEVVRPEDGFPVLNEGRDSLIEVFYSNHNQKYAIYKAGHLTTDFIYDECGSCVEGLLAVCQNGKWGYVNESGEVIIPIEFDASWDKYDLLGYTEEPQFEDYCYAASDGYVTLCKEGQWELRTVDNRIAISPGLFEKILPVYEGKCWVKVDGKWGVIEIHSSNDKDIVPEQEMEDDWEVLIESQEQEEVEVEAISVEDRIKEIREVYYGIQERVGSMRKEDGGAGTVRYLENGEIVKIVASKGAYYDFNESDSYTAEYYYKDEMIEFVFVYGKGEEHRFYIDKRDRSKCVRYIDENGETHDYPKGKEFGDVDKLARFCNFANMEIGWSKH